MAGNWGKMMDCLSEGKKTSFEYVWLVDKLYQSLFLMWLIRVTDRGEREREREDLHLHDGPPKLV